jgi:hypothetical protein
MLVLCSISDILIFEVSFLYLFTNREGRGVFIVYELKVYVMTSRLFRDTSCNVSVVFTDQGKPPKTTNNTDEKGGGNEDADSPASDKQLDVGDHYVVRRPDGSLRELFPYVWYLHVMYSGRRGLKSYKEFSTFIVYNIEKNC